MSDGTVFTREERQIFDDYDAGAFDSIDTSELRADLAAAARNTLND